jgi:hypothetical protein
MQPLLNHSFYLIAILSIHGPPTFSTSKAPIASATTRVPAAAPISASQKKHLHHTRFILSSINLLWSNLEETKKQFRSN